MRSWIIRTVRFLETLPRSNRKRKQHTYSLITGAATCWDRTFLWGPAENGMCFEEAGVQPFSSRCWNKEAIHPPTDIKANMVCLGMFIPMI